MLQITTTCPTLFLLQNWMAALNNERGCNTKKMKKKYYGEISDRDNKPQGQVFTILSHS